MKTALQKLRHGLNTKLGFFLLVVLLFCLKSYWAYQNEFNLSLPRDRAVLPGTVVILADANYQRVAVNLALRKHLILSRILRLYYL